MKVNLKENSYKIVIGYNNIHRFAEYLEKIVSTDKENISIFIISSPKIFNLYGIKIKTILENNSWTDIGIGLFPDGEKNKSFTQYKNILGKLLDFDAGKKKDIIILNLGGGVVGDLGGFVASTYRRGIPYIQIPTTLLSCVDSSIGGKTGIDFERKNKIIKNFIGNFYQPELVFMDLSFLETLSEKEILNGIAEIIKYGIIKDEFLFEYTLSNLKDIIKSVKKKLFLIVKKSSNLKRIIVQKDEKETKGIRTILNFGHTIGHAIEGAYRFKYTHGEAISIGMITEAKISYKLGLLNIENFTKILKILSIAKLPLLLEKNKINKVIEIMKYDKKFKEGKNKFVLPVKIGKVIIKENVPQDLIVDSLLNV